MLQKNPPPTLQICFANFRMCSASRQKTRFARYAPGEIKLLGNRGGAKIWFSELIYTPAWWAWATAFFIIWWIKQSENMQKKNIFELIILVLSQEWVNLFLFTYHSLSIKWHDSHQGHWELGSTTGNSKSYLARRISIKFRCSKLSIII